MEVAVSLSDSPDASIAGKQAARELRAGLTGDPDFIFTLIAEKYGKDPQKYQNCLTAFKKEIGEDIPSIGCISPEIFVSGNLPTIRGVATMGIRGDEIQMYPSYYQSYRSNYQRIAESMAKQYMPLATRSKNNTTILFPSGPIYPEGSLNDLKVINTFFAHSLTPVFRVISSMIQGKQASAGIGSPSKATMELLEILAKRGISRTIGGNSISSEALYAYEFFNDTVLSNSVVSCLLTSDDYKFGTSWAFGGIDTGKKLIVNKSIPGGILLEANNKNALDAMCEAINFQKEDLNLFIGYALVYHLLIASEPSRPSQYPYISIAAPFLDGIVSMLPDQGMRENDCLSIYSQSGKNILDSIKPCIDRAKENIQKPEFAFIFECSNRAMALQDKIHEEMPIFDEALNGIPFIGFGGGGEFSFKGSGFHYVNSTIHALVAGK